MKDNFRFKNVVFKTEIEEKGVTVVFLIFENLKEGRRIIELIEKWNNPTVALVKNEDETIDFYLYEVGGGNTCALKNSKTFHQRTDLKYFLAHHPPDKRLVLSYAILTQENKVRTDPPNHLLYVPLMGYVYVQKRNFHFQLSHNPN